MTFKGLASLINPIYDIIVVGGGHAGSEACAAAARMSCKTLLVTTKFETIGEMSCNPSFGGIGKGQLLREIDALDGISPRICDMSGLAFKVLNKSKGPAVWGHRAQIDRNLYRKNMQEELMNTPNLDIYTASVDDLIIEKNIRGSIVCRGIVDHDGKPIYSKATIITTGTFLRGQINIGAVCYPAGRLNEKPTIKLAETIERLKFKMGRLKTGTPPRLDPKTIDYNKCTIQDPDNPPRPFSFMNQKVTVKPEDQMISWLTITTPDVHRLVHENMQHNIHVTGGVTGVRHCPSIERKVLNFKDKQFPVWLEPETRELEVIYPNGITCTVPADIQQKIVNAVIGLEHAKIIRPGYGIEYDHVDPRELKPSLETKKVDGLFLAGQINGTTGYEEAASQGVMAGINAASKIKEKEPLILSREESYIGVLIDDLIKKGVTEPYRMFTSRAEHRLIMRSDNADRRLTRKGWFQGCVSSDRYEMFNKFNDAFEEAINLLSSDSKSMYRWRKILNLDHKRVEASVKTGMEALDIFQGDLIKELDKLYPNMEVLIGRSGFEKDRFIELLQIEAIYRRWQNQPLPVMYSHG